jgi:hypothetical protein
MSSKLSRSLNKRHDNLGLGTPHNKIRVAPTHRKKDKENMDNQAKPQEKKDTEKKKEYQEVVQLP